MTDIGRSVGTTRPRSPGWRCRQRMTADAWNRRYPVGTPVRYYPVEGSAEYSATRTRSDAWAMGCGEPVVLVDGKTGGVSLAHIQVILRHAEPTP